MEGQRTIYRRKFKNLKLRWYICAWFDLGRALQRTWDYYWEILRAAKLKHKYCEKRNQEKKRDSENAIEVKNCEHE